MPGSTVSIVASDEALVARLVTLADTVGIGCSVDLRDEVPEALLLREGLVLVGPGGAANLPSGPWVARVVVVGAQEARRETWADAVRIGAERVVTVPEDEPWLLDRLARLATPDHQARSVAVLAGHGGAGASTLAVGLAIEGARHGARVVLVDADPLGGGLDLPLGLSDVSGIHWDDLPLTSGRRLRAGDLPGDGGIHLLTGSRTRPGSPRGGRRPASLSVARDAISALRLEADLVVSDVSRALGVVDELALAGSELTVLVARPGVREAAAAMRMVDEVRDHCPAMGLVVRGPRRLVLSRELGRLLELTTFGVVADEPALALALDDGLPVSESRSRSAGVCRAVLAAVGLR